MPHVFALRDHLYIVGGDWNFEPDDFPIDLARGDTLVRPPSDDLPTSPYGGRKIDWFLIAPHMRDSVSAEARIDLKPDHGAVQITLAANWVKQSFLKRIKGAMQEHDNPVDHWRQALIPGHGGQLQPRGT
eukprot:6465724-Amphidinium_carterae.2